MSNQGDITRPINQGVLQGPMLTFPAGSSSPTWMVDLAPQRHLNVIIIVIFFYCSLVHIVYELVLTYSS